MKNNLRCLCFYSHLKNDSETFGEEIVATLIRGFTSKIEFSREREDNEYKIMNLHAVSYCFSICSINEFAEYLIVEKSENDI